MAFCVWHLSASGGPQPANASGAGNGSPVSQTEASFRSSSSRRWREHRVSGFPPAASPSRRCGRKLRLPILRLWRLQFRPASQPPPRSLEEATQHCMKWATWAGHLSPCLHRPQKVWASAPAGAPRSLHLAEPHPQEGWGAWSLIFSDNEWFCRPQYLQAILLAADTHKPVYPPIFSVMSPRCCCYHLPHTARGLLCRVSFQPLELTPHPHAAATQLLEGERSPPREWLFMPGLGFPSGDILLSPFKQPYCTIFHILYSSRI